MAARRAAKAVPYLGTVMAIGFVGYDIKKKGFVKGVINSGLDAIPLVGTGKNIIEFFTGDLLSDKKEPKKKFFDKVETLARAVQAVAETIPKADYEKSLQG